MRVFKAVAAALFLAAFAGAPARAQTVKYLNQLSGAAAVAGTNTLPLCQTGGGCGSGVPLTSATIAQLETYIQSVLYPVPLADIATIGANTLLGNATSATAAPTAVPMPSCSGANQALNWTSGTGAGCVTISGGGGSPGGSSGQVQYNNSGAFGGFTLGGDATLNTGTGALTVTKTNGTAFGSLATESAITSGQLPALASGDFWLGNGSSVATAKALSGDCALANTGAITCTKTSGTAFGTLATLSTVPLGDLAAIGADTVLGNASGSSAAPAALSQTQLTALCNVFTSSLLGCVPASGGGTTNFLRADGTWAAPPGGGSFSAAVNRITTGTTNTLASITAPFTTEIWASGTTGAKTDTVPGCVSGLNGDVLIEADEEGTAATYPITVTPTSGTIGQAGTPAPGGSYAISAPGAVAKFQCDGAATRWVLQGVAGGGSGVNYQTTNYTVAPSDNGGVIDVTGSGLTVTLPQAGVAAGFPEGSFSTLIRNSGSSSLILAATTSVINLSGATGGVTSTTIPAGSSMMIFADLSGNYEGVPLAGSSGSSSGGLSLTPIIGAWYWPFIGEGWGTGEAEAAGRVVCTPGVMLFPAHVEAITIQVATVGTSTDDIALAVYATGTNGYPNGAPVFTATGQAEGASAGVLMFSGLSGVLSAGEYWFCRQSNDSAVVITSINGPSGAGSYSAFPLIGQPSSSSTFLSAVNGYYVSGTYGTWPTFSGNPGWTSVADGPAMTLQISSSP